MKPAIFDLVLTFIIAVYLTLVYYTIQVIHVTYILFISSFSLVQSRNKLFTFANQPIRVNKKRNETEILCSDWFIDKSKNKNFYSHGIRSLIMYVFSIFYSYFLKLTCYYFYDHDFSNFLYYTRRYLLRWRLKRKFIKL